MSKQHPLSNLTVLELSTMIAGPFAGQLLGDLGADVIKIERPGQGELARSINPKVGGPSGESFYYLTANRNKRSLAIDITADRGRDIFLTLAEQADVILENYPTSFTERYSIGFDTIRERNPTIRYCSISAFGATGPKRDDPGIDTTVQALSGSMSMTREDDGPPLRSGVPMNDVFAALYAVQGILASLYHGGGSDEESDGEFIDVSLLDAGIAGLTTRATYSLATEEPYPPFGRRHNYFAPEGVFEARDGEVHLSVITDRHWQWFCEALDLHDMADDERFKRVNDRVANRETLEDILSGVLKEWSSTKLIDTLGNAGIPVAPINDTQSVWEEPQVKARDMRLEIDHPSIGPIENLGFPVKYEEIQPEIHRHPPALGEHTSEILTTLGYGEQTISNLREAGVIDTREG